MTPEQAQRLGELHEAEVQARWEWGTFRTEESYARVTAACQAFYAYLNSITETQASTPPRQSRPEYQA
jgi:hypothetical protein